MRVGCFKSTLAVALVSVVLAGPAFAADQIPLLVYPFTGNPHPTPGQYNGVLIKGLISLGERKNKPYLEQLRAKLDEITPGERFQKTFGCIFSESVDSCQTVRIVTTPFFGEDGPSADLVDALEPRRTYESYCS